MDAARYHRYSIHLISSLQSLPLTSTLPQLGCHSFISSVQFVFYTTLALELLITYPATKRLSNFIYTSNMRFSASVILSGLLATGAMAAPTALQKRGVLTKQSYNQFQISDGTAGNAQAEVLKKFPVCSP